VSWCAFPGAGWRWQWWNFAGLARKYNRQPTDSEVEALEISAEQWQEIKLAWVNRPLLDIPVQDAEEGATCLGMVPDTQYRSFQLAQEEIRLNKL